MMCRFQFGKLWQRILLKERSSPYHYGVTIMSDHSLSSWYRDHSRSACEAIYFKGFACVSSHLMSSPILSNRCTCLVDLFVNHSRCMHDHPNTECAQTKIRYGSRRSYQALDHLATDRMIEQKMPRVESQNVGRDVWLHEGVRLH